MGTQIRVSRGVTAGGQYATKTHAEADISLDQTPDAEPCHLEVADIEAGDKIWVSHMNTPIEVVIEDPDNWPEGQVSGVTHWTRNDYGTERRGETRLWFGVENAFATEDEATIVHTERNKRARQALAKQQSKIQADRNRRYEAGWWD